MAFASVPFSVPIGRFSWSDTMRMRFSLVYAVLLAGSLLSLTACDDSSDVGLGVGSDPLEGGVPKTYEVSPDNHSITRDPPVTGRSLDQGTWRFLTGRVEELPQTENNYTVHAEGYVDFLGRSSLPDEIGSADAEDLSAELRLPRSYLHGDTTSTLDVRLYDLTEEADMNQATADTAFSAEAEPFLNTSISPTDTLATIDLPSGWVQEHLDILQNTSDGGDTFSEDFHGFKITTSQGNAVVGFSSTETSLRLTYEPDSTSADFQGIKSFTHVDHSNLSFSSDEYWLLQDGVGRSFSMEWNFDTPPLDTLREAPLNRAEIFVPTDSTELASTVSNPHFVRPSAQGFRILATRSQEGSSCAEFGTVAVSETDCALPVIPQAAPKAARVGNDIAFPIFRESLLEEPIFTKYRVEIADRTSTDIQPRGTINPGLPSVLPVLIPKPNSADDGSVTGPRAILTITQL